MFASRRSTASSECLPNTRVQQTHSSASRRHSPLTRGPLGARPAEVSRTWSIRSVLAGCVILGLRCGFGGNAPSAKFGPEDPGRGSGTVRNVSAKFTSRDLERLHERLNSTEFQRQLTRYNCGDPVPKVEFTVSLWEPGEYQERHVLVQPRPMFEAGGRERCLSFGLGYLLDLEVKRFDTGPPIDYHYRNPETGKDFGPEAYALPVPREPVCDCSKRDSRTEWLSWPERTPTP
jgi:hypothetical protein